MPDRFGAATFDQAMKAAAKNSRSSRRLIGGGIVWLVLTAVWAGGASADSGAARNAGQLVGAPSRAEGATVARIVIPTRGRVRLDRPRPTRPIAAETSWSGQPTTLLVLAAARYRGREWVKLLMPERPNGSTAWVPRDRVVLSHSPYWVQVDLGRRRLSVYRDGRLIRRYRAVVGKPSTPTPRGLASIYERNRQPDPQGFEGTWVLALTAESDVLKHFEGGTGRIGIHGRGGTSLLDPLGSARSHGCVRLSDRPVSWMAAHVPIGTPVKIAG